MKCPHDQMDMERAGFSWRCPICCREVPDLQGLPSLVAIALQEARAESHPVMRLHRICDAAEILTRFCTILALGELRVHSGSEPLPESLLDQIRQDIRHPTWGQWFHILRVVVEELAGIQNLVVPGLVGFVRDHVLTLAPEEGNPENSLLVLRNLIAHGGPMRTVHATAFLAISEPRLADVFAQLSFLGEAEVYHVSGGMTQRLMGHTAAGDEPERPAAELMPGRDVAALEGHVVLLRGGALLDLWPLCDYDWARMQGTSGPRVAAEPGPLMYLRAEPDRLLYAALGVDLPLGEKADGLQSFRALFALDQAKPAARVAEVDFEAEIRLDSAALVGREDELRQAKDLLKKAQTGVFWLSGPGGIGKSFLMAKLAEDLRGDAKRVCRIAWRFKVGDQGRGNPVAFLRHAVAKLAAWQHLNKPDLYLSYEADKLLDQLWGLLDEASRLVPHNERERPPRVLFVLDGMDEIARLDESFVKLPFELVRPNVVWLCAGRPEGCLPDMFAADRCTHVFPGGLPPMSAKDIRGMLLDNTGKLKYALLCLDREQPGQVTNEAVEAVVARAAGLPLYVHFVVEDILSGSFAMARLPGELPPSLSDYYAELLRRVQISSLQALLTPLVVTIAWAKAPLEKETLHLLMVRHKVLDESEASRALLQRGLDALQGMVRLTAVAGSNDLGYEIYHPTFREHIHSDLQGTLAIQNRLARQDLCEMVRQWSRIEEPHPARAYALRHGVSHVLEEVNLDGVCDLVRSGFLTAQAKAVDDAISLVDSRRMAQRLAEAGDGYWDDLLACADSYCNLIERLGGIPGTVEALIRQRAVPMVQSALEAETDPLRRDYFCLATAVLLADAGYETIAAPLLARSAGALRDRIGSSGTPFGTPLDSLARALLNRVLPVVDSPLPTPAAANDSSPSPPPCDPSEFAELSPRSAVPVGDMLIAFFWSGERLAGMWSFCVGGMILFGFAWYWGIHTHWWIVSISLGLLLFGTSLGALSWFGLKRAPLRPAQIMASMARAAEQAPPNEQWQILLRALYYRALLEECPRELGMAGPRPLSVSEFGQLIRQQLRAAEEADQLPAFIQVMAAMGRDCSRLVAAELRRLEPRELRVAMLRAAEHPAGIIDPKGFAEILAGTVDLAPRPELLAEYTNLVPDSTELFRRASSVDLARGLLSGLGQRRERRWRHLPGGMRRDLLRLWCRVRLEFQLWRGLPKYLPLALLVLWGRIAVPLCLLGLAVGLGLPWATVMIMFILLGQSSDWFALGPSHCSQEEVRKRRRDVAAKHPFPFLACFDGRRFRAPAVAWAILRKNAGEYRDLAQLPFSELYSVVTKLASAGLFRQLPDLVLMNMSDRARLQALRTLRKKRGAGAIEREPSEAKYADELSRALPLPRSANLVCTVIFAVAGITFWAGMLWLTFGRADPESPLLIAMVAGVVFSICQHLNYLDLSHLRAEGDFDAPAVFACGAKGTLVCLPVGLLIFVLWLLSAIRLTNLFWLSGLSALAITNLFVPELIARWRGAGLLFPTWWQLWRQRLLSVSIAIAICLLLGWLTAVAVRLAAPAG